MYDARLQDSLKVCDMIEGGKWKCPTEWYDHLAVVTSLEDLVVNNDKIIWRMRSGKEVDFAVKHAYDDLYGNG